MATNSSTIGRFRLPSIDVYSRENPSEYLHIVNIAGNYSS